MPLIQQLIKKRTRHWSAELVRDPVQEKLLDIIEAKRKKAGKPKREKRAETQEPSNVINIMDALKKSVEAESRRGKR